MRVFLLAAVSLAIAGCVSTSTAMLDERTAVISGRGSGYSSPAQVQQRVLLEAAQTAQARGFRYFAVISSTDQSTRGQIVTPGTNQTTGSVFGSCTGPFCSGTYSGQTTVTPAQVFDFVKPGQDILIRFYREGEVNANARGVWDSMSILAAQQK